MSNQTPNLAQDYFVTGGTMAPKAPSYLVRAADDEILQQLLDGQFCYVLTSRQMGKSSLLSRAAMRLRENGRAVSFFELSAIGINLTASQWFDGILERVGADFDLEDEIDEFREKNATLGPQQMWLEVLRRVILVNIPNRNIVIIVDEIDMVRSLRENFDTDEFFSGIRELYNRRSHDPELQRITFCLLGVASPGDLMANKQVTPFNIGNRIEIRDFTRAECDGLANGFPDLQPDAITPLLDRIHYWTGGQPYLTQRLAKAVAQDPSVRNPAAVDEIAKNLFLSQKARETDSNLTFVRDRVIKEPEGSAPLLTLYLQVIKGKKTPDSEINPATTKLKLAGLVRNENGLLAVRNPIYKHNFNARWVRENLPRDWARIAAKSFRWAAAILLFLCLPLSVWALRERSSMEHERNLAEQSSNIAREQKEVAENARMLASMEKADADKLREEAIKTSKDLEDKKRRLEKAFETLFKKEMQTAFYKGSRHVEVALLQATAVHDKEINLPSRPQITVEDEDGNTTNVGFTTRIEPLGSFKNDSAILSAHTWHLTPGIIMEYSQDDGSALHYIHLNPEKLPSSEKTNDKPAWVMLYDAEPSDQEPDFSNHDLVRDTASITGTAIIFMIDNSGRLHAWNLEKRVAHELDVDIGDGFISLCQIGNTTSIVISKEDGSLIVMNALDGSVTKTLETAPSAILKLTSSPSGEILLGADLNGRVMRWDMKDGKINANMDWTLPSRVRDIRFHPQKPETFLMAAEDGTLRCHELTTGQSTREPLSVTGGLETATWSPDGSILLTGGHDGFARIWKWNDLTKDTPELSMEIPLVSQELLTELKKSEDGGFPRSLRVQVEFRPDGKSFIVGNRLRLLGEFSLPDGKPLVAPVDGNLDGKFTSSFLITPDGMVIRAGVTWHDDLWQGLFATKRNDTEWQILTDDPEPTEPQIIGQHFLDLPHGIFAADPLTGTFAYTQGDSPSINIVLDKLTIQDGIPKWNEQKILQLDRKESSSANHKERNATGEEDSKTETQESNKPTAIALSPQATSLAVAFSDGSLMVWNLREKNSPPVPAKRKVNDMFGKESITKLAFMRSDELLAVSTTSKTVVYNAMTWKIENDYLLKLPYSTAMHSLHCLSSSERNESSLLMTLDSTPQSGFNLIHEERSFPGEEITSLAISSDGNCQLLGLKDGRIAFVKGEGKSETVPAHCDNKITSVAFFPNSQGFVSTSYNEIQFWKIHDAPRDILPADADSDALAEACRRWRLQIDNFTEFASTPPSPSEELDQLLNSLNYQVTTPHNAETLSSYRTILKFAELYMTPELPSLKDLLELLPATEEEDLDTRATLRRLLLLKAPYIPIELKNDLSNLSVYERWLVLSTRYDDWQKFVPPNTAAEWQLFLAAYEAARVAKVWNSPETFNPLKLAPEWQIVWQNACKKLEMSIDSGALELSQATAILEGMDFPQADAFSKMKDFLQKLPSIETIDNDLRADDIKVRTKTLPPLRNLMDKGYEPHIYILINAGIALRLDKQFDEAMKFHALALEQTKRDNDTENESRVMISMAYTHDGMNNQPEAIKSARAATTVAPESPYAWYHRATFEITTDPKTGKTDQERLKQLIAEYSAAVPKFQNYDDLSTPVKFIIANWRKQAGDTEGAMKEYKATLEADPSIANYKAFREKWQYDNAEEEEWSIRLIEEKLKETDISNDPENQAWLLSRHAADMKGNFRFREASTYFLRSLNLEKDPGNMGWCQTELADNFALFGDYEKALEYFEIGLENDKDDWVYVRMGNALWKSGKRKEALDAIKSSFTEKGNVEWDTEEDAVALYAWYLAETGRTSGALSLLADGVGKSNTYTANFHLTSARIYAKMIAAQTTPEKLEGTREKMTKEIESALEQYAKQEKPLHLEMANCALLLPDIERADTFLNQYNEIWRESDHPPALLARAAIANHQNKNDLALTFVAKAVALGYYDAQSIISDPVFAELTKIEGMDSLLKILALKPQGNTEQDYANREKALAEWSSAMAQKFPTFEKDFLDTSKQFIKNSNIPLVPKPLE